MPKLGINRDHRHIRPPLCVAEARSVILVSSSLGSRTFGNHCFPEACFTCLTERPAHRDGGANAHTTGNREFVCTSRIGYQLPAFPGSAVISHGPKANGVQVALQNCSGNGPCPSSSEVGTAVSLLRFAS